MPLRISNHHVFSIYLMSRSAESKSAMGMQFRNVWSIFGHVAIIFYKHVAISRCTHLQHLKDSSGFQFYVYFRDYIGQQLGVVFITWFLIVFYAIWGGFNYSQMANFATLFGSILELPKNRPNLDPYTPQLSRKYFQKYKKKLFEQH